MRGLVLPQAVLASLNASTKKDVLTHIASAAAGLVDQNAQIIFDILWEREKLGTTGVGHGIAIPHGRISGLEKVSGFFARLSQPVNFDSIDNKPVDLVFMLLAPESAGADHLHALATVSRILRNEKLCEHLRTAKDEAEIYRILVENTERDTAEPRKSIA